MELNPLPGFRDFYPEDAARRDYIFNKWRQTAYRYGFSAYDGPLLENTDLYRKKSGDELMGQLYCFVDKGGRDVSLRPEMTPSLARMIANKGHSLPKPIRWYSTPQFFRYERQQRGRLREFYQLNFDILGESDISADTEVVALAIDTLRAFGLTSSDFQVHVNDRLLLNALFDAIGIIGDDAHKIVFTAVDKWSRGSPEKIKEIMVKDGIESSQADQVLSLFQKKNLMEIASEYDSSEKVSERILALQCLFGWIDIMGLSDYVKFDHTIVRGLAYYTGIVFEALDCKGTLRSICGGGRYDHLIKKIGGVDMPAVGFAMGDVVLSELLSERHLWPSKLLPSIDLYLILIDEKLRSPLLSLAHQLRDAGWSVEYPFTETSVGKQFKTASQREAKYAIVIAPEEWQRGIVKLKNMQTREEKEIHVAEIQSHLLKIIAPSALNF